MMNETAVRKGGRRSKDVNKRRKLYFFFLNLLEDSVPDCNYYNIILFNIFSSHIDE